MIKVNGRVIEFKTFPNGETQVVHEQILESLKEESNIVSLKYEDDKDLIRLMFLKNYIDEKFSMEEMKLHLIMYYMPYSRMDRTEGDSVFTLKYISEFINNLKFQKITVVEPHSDVSTALLKNVEARFLTVEMLPYIKKGIGFDEENDFIVFPDLGASRRYKNIKMKNMLIGNKVRDFETGEITSLELVGEFKDTKIRRALIVDDLCSGGYTFYMTAERLREMGVEDIYLLVAHTENTVLKGKMLESGLIKKVFTTDSIITEEHDDIVKYKVENLVWEGTKI